MLAHLADFSCSCPILPCPMEMCLLAEGEDRIAGLLWKKRMKSSTKRLELETFN